MNADDGAPASGATNAAPYSSATSASSDGSAACQTRHDGCATSYSIVPPSRWRVYPQKCSVTNRASLVGGGTLGAAPAAVAATCCQPARRGVRHA